jgi:hypothetical protein
VRHQAIGLLDEPRDLGPVGAVVEHDADPSAASDVRRTEVPLGVRLDQRLLGAETGGEPHREVLRPVVVVVEHREDLALAREPGRLAVRELLDRLGQGEADGAQPCERALALLT